MGIFLGLTAVNFINTRERLCVPQHLPMSPRARSTDSTAMILLLKLGSSDGSCSWSASYIVL